MSDAQFTVADRRHMARALELARRGRFTTAPNPNVGCVLVQGDSVVGEGYHVKAGEGHAEVNALRMAGDKARGSTAYVTLEPCSHYGRTPPCADGLINAGVARVVVAMTDPNPQVAGRGLKKLTDAGICVAHGLMEAEARALNPGFIKRMEQGLPFVTVKLGASLDGRTALNNGESQWITSPLARQDVQRFRAASHGILSGSGTVLADDPSLNVRYAELGLDETVLAEEQLRQPLRVIVDSSNRVMPEAKLAGLPGEVWLLRREEDGLSWPESVEQLLLEGDGQLDLREAMQVLAARGVNDLWVEAGAKLTGALLVAGLVDRVIIYQAPKLMGDEGRGLFHLPGIKHMPDVIDLEIADLRMVGPDVRIIATPIVRRKKA